MLQLVDAANQRQDDLREMQASAQERLASLRQTFMEQLANMRERHATEARRSEAERINAIRAVDVGAVAAAAAVQATQATTLAAQVASSAEAMRTQVETTRLQIQAQNSAALEPIIKDVATLRQVQYEQAGGRAQMVESREIGGSRMAPAAIGIAVVAVVSFVLMQQLGSIRRTQYEAVGGRAQVVESRAKGANTTIWLMVVIGAVGLLLTTVVIAVAVLAATGAFK